MADPAATEDRLEETLSRPAAEDRSLMTRLDGDILVLGVAGKMGPTLARLALRASAAAGRSRRVVGVSRFSSPGVRLKLEGWGIETLAADLLSRRQVQALPHARNVIYMAGQKFGTSGDPSGTWAANAYIASLVAEKYAGSRIVVFSSGNVYALSSAPGKGPDESCAPGPVGEYAQSVLARERLFEHFSKRNGTPVAIMRLNYAVEPRYGVLRDIADAVAGRQPVDLTMGWVNVIWQRDANSIALRLLERCASPPFLLNVTGAACLRVRDLALELGRALGERPRFQGTEARSALLSDASLCESVFGPPSMTADRMIRAVANWVRAGGPGLGKPTHFQERGGSF